MKELKYSRNINIKIGARPSSDSYTSRRDLKSKQTKVGFPTRPKKSDTSLVNCGSYYFAKFKVSKMSDGKWMFGGSSDPSLLVANNEKKTFFNRELGDNYTEGFQIGENETSDGYQNKRAAQAAYQAALESDQINFKSDNLPDARRTRTFIRKDNSDNEHPLGSSMLMALGESTKNRMNPKQVEIAQLKREELNQNRFDIINLIEKDTSPMNSPRYRNEMELGVKDPSTDGSGIMAIGSTAAQEKASKVAKQKEYMAQLNADRGIDFGISEYDPQESTLNRDKSYKRIEKTGHTGYNISTGPSLDMSPSMKNIDFEIKRQRQAAYRNILDQQKQLTAALKQQEKNNDNSVNDENNMPYMQNH